MSICSGYCYKMLHEWHSKSTQSRHNKVSATIGFKDREKCNWLAEDHKSCNNAYCIQTRKSLHIPLTESEEGLRNNVCRQQKWETRLQTNYPQAGAKSCQWKTPTSEENNREAQ